MYWHIEDEMGVCMTLLAGQSRALLVDTGYGLSDVSARVRALTALPLTVLLTHGHHDHAMGAQWFDEVLLHPDDLPVYETYTNAHWRTHVLAGAAMRGLRVDTARYLAAPVAKPLPLTEGEIDLGGLTARILPSPGHTPGSVAVFVPEERLLLTGDTWNPTTWCFFPESLPVDTLLSSLRNLLTLPFDTVLCPHQAQPQPREKVLCFAEAMTETALRQAEEDGSGAAMHIPTRAVRLPDGQTLVFDPRKQHVSTQGEQP